MFSDNYLSLLKFLFVSCVFVTILVFLPNVFTMLGERGFVRFTSQAETVEYEVDATVVDSYFRDSYTSCIYTGKTIVPIHHFATYKIVVMYEEKTYEFYGKEIYYKYKDSIGETVPVLLEVRTYEDGYVSMDIKEIL